MGQVNRLDEGTHRVLQFRPDENHGRRSKKTNNKRGEILVNGQKKIIEMCGDFWHKGQNPEDRKAIFAPYGWKTLIVWEHELEDIQSLSNKLTEFHGGK